jgi:predicted PurR-regulated permease PerM
MEQVAGVIALAALAGTALIVVAPFITALLWGAILAYCSWHPYQKLVRAFKGHRALAALAIVLTTLVLLIVPAVYGGLVFSAKVPELVMLAQKHLAGATPPLPQWLVQLPMVGPRLEDTWDAVATRNPAMIERLRELARPVLFGALGATLAVFKGLGLLVLSVLFAAFFYLSGERLGMALAAALHKIAGGRAPALLTLVGATVKGVVYGILGTSLVLAVLCGIGYWIAGLPSAGLLAVATFFLAIIPGGPLLIIVPAVIWLVQQGETAWALFVALWSIVAAVGVNNVLAPLIIGRSSDVPLILIVIGVIGGAAAFGLLGLFVGPTVLAVANAVLRDWTATPEVSREAAKVVPVGERGPGMHSNRPGEQPT